MTTTLPAEPNTRKRETEEHLSVAITGRTREGSLQARIVYTRIRFSDPNAPGGWRDTDDANSLRKNDPVLRFLGTGIDCAVGEDGNVSVLAYDKSLAEALNMPMTSTQSDREAKAKFLAGVLSSRLRIVWAYLPQEPKAVGEAWTFSRESGMTGEIMIERWKRAQRRRSSAD
jgi:hypothetical protein